MEQPDWQALLEQAQQTSVTIRKAMTYAGKFPTDTFARPRILIADDGQEYVVKALRTDNSGMEIARTLIIEQVVGRLANRISAPVPPVTLINVSQSLIEIEPELNHFQPGIAHASQRVRECSPTREGIAHTDVAENRERFSLLAVLYGWFGAQDHQWIYANSPPQLVYSVDHGHFIFSGAAWLPAMFPKHNTAECDIAIVGQCGLTPQELQVAAQRLANLTPATIVEAVAAVPASWGTTMEDRIAFSEYTFLRYSSLLQSIPV